MKLSKEDLSYIFDCADDPDSCVRGGLDMDDVKNAFIEGTLEIEGYERFKWTRFDPDDPKTFPPELTRVQVFDKESGEVLTAKYDYDSREWSLSWCMITHWRPLPKPPAESEVWE